LQPDVRFYGKMHQIRFRLGLPDPGRRAYSAPPDLLVAFKGLLLKERRVGNGRMRGESGGREEKGPKGLIYTSMSEILKNTLIAELI